MDFKQAMIIRHDLGMGKGKIAAQCAHASLGAFEKAQKQYPEWVEGWKESGQTKIVLKVANKQELLALFESTRKIIPAALIKDAGRTQIDAGEETCVALGPAPDAQIDKFTKGLKLL